MIKIKVVAVGSLKEKFFDDACNEYLKRISRFASISVCQLKEKHTLEEEGECILKACEGYVIVLDVKGKKMSSPDLSNVIENAKMTNASITFVVGSSCGLCDSVKNAANLKLSFSDMTFPHQLFRVMLLEQIYRALCIGAGVTYHK